MWPFGRTKTLRELENERFPELVDSVAKKWPKYLKEFEGAGIERPPLALQVASFGVRAAQALRKGHFALRRSEDNYFMVAVAVGIVKSGEYSKEEVEQAVGFRIPDNLLH